MKRSRTEIKSNKRGVEFITRLLLNKGKGFMNRESLLDNTIVKDVMVTDKSPYLNAYSKQCTFRDPNPAVVIISILKDLLFLLRKFEKAGPNMFYEVKRSSQFEIIETEIASLRNPKFFIKSQTNEKTIYWLNQHEEKLSFFLNLHNFLILYGLCKYSGLHFPKTQLEWTKFSNLVALKIAGSTYTAAEIEHAILRAVMTNPNTPSISLEELSVYPKFGELDLRRNLICTKKEPLLSFALYFPTVSSPSLRVYVPKKVHAQMKTNCASYLEKTIKVSNNKTTLTLPSLLDWYSEDFIKSRTKTDYIFFVQGNATKETLKRIKGFEQSAVKQIQFENYNWSFNYNYIEDK